jgi:hypothetical protein
MCAPVSIKHVVGRLRVSGVVLLAVVSTGCASSRGSGIDVSLVAYPSGSARPTAGTVTVTSGSRQVARRRTDGDGSLSLNLAAGTYVLDAATSSGGQCRNDIATVRKGGRTSVTLICI